MKIFEKLVRLVWGGVLKLFHIEWTEEKWTSFMQFVKFCLVGVSNTIVSYLLNIAVLFLLKNAGLSFDYVIANIVAFVLSVLWSFFWNNRFVFTKEEGEKRSVWKTLLKTYVAYSVTGIVLNNALSYIWIDVFGISKFIAPIINLVVAVPINFLLNKLWAYKTD
ncbi:MAG: GtrA family protein [Lachnospiraceae bacterium]|nr:GtrA family protein [Lachnospiraceae bacterium]